MCVLPQQVEAATPLDSLFPFLKPPIPDYVLESDRVYFENDDVWIEASPNILTSSGWVTVNFKTKKYSGDLDICYGFNGIDNVEAIKTDIYTDYAHTLYKSNEVIKTETFIPSEVISLEKVSSGVANIGDKSLNANFAKIRYKKNDLNNVNTVYESYIAYDSTDGKSFTYKNKSNEQIPYQSVFKDWKSIKSIKNTSNILYKGSNKWQSQNLDVVVRNKIYTTRVWIEIPFSGKNTISGKYSIGLKPSGSDIIKAWVLDPWYNASWAYRKSIIIAHTDDGAQTNYQVKLLVGESSGAAGEQFDLGGHCASDFDDLRFTKSDGETLLDYWIESLSGASPNQLATVWVEIDSIAAHPNDTTIYIYYGNAGAAAASSITATFPFADHFDDASIDGAKWYHWIDNGSETESGTVFAITGHASYNAWGAKTKYATNYAYRGRVYASAETGNDAVIFGCDDRSDDGSAVGTGTDDACFKIANPATKKYQNCREGTGTITDRSETLTTYQVLEIQRNSTTNVKFLINDVLKNTSTTNLPTDTCGFMFYADSAITIYIDWVCARKFTVNEPAYGSVGAEESYSIPYPSITINSAYDIEETTASLNATVTSAYSQTMRGFAWGTTSNATSPVNEQPPASYTSNWTEVSASTGNFNHGLISLTSGDKYYFRAYSYNATGYGWSSENSFLTKPTEPTNFTCTTNSTAVDLSWTNAVVGAGTTVHTVVRYKTGGYPANIADGTLSCNITDTSYVQTGLIDGTLYYFRAWTWANDGTVSQYSDTYASCSSTPSTNIVTTKTCSGFSQEWAILNGQLDTDSTATQVGFDYGLTPIYGSSSVTSGSFSSGIFSKTILGLTPATVYYYRAKALVGGVWVYGEQRTFSTKGSPAMYEYWDTGGDTDSFKIDSANVTYQTFTTNTTDISHSVTSFKLKLKRVGTPGNVVASIKHTANSTTGQTCWSYPTGDNIISATLDGDTFDLNYTWYEFIPDVETCLSANTTYAIVVKADSGDSSNYIMWQADAGGGYTGGNSGYSTDSGVNWTNNCPTDQLFEIWGNPCLEVLDAKVFSGYIEDGDWLITVLYKNFFQPYYEQAKDVQSLFYLQLADGTTVKASTILPEWGYRPACIYLSATEVTQLEWGEDYTVRIYCNFGAYPYSAYSLQSTDWLGSDLARLDSWVRTSAKLMEDYYETTYTEYVSGKGLVLNEAGGVIFANNIPELDTVRPDIFKINSNTVDYETDDYTQDLQADLVWQTMWGPQITRAFTLTGNAYNLQGNQIGMLIGFLVYAMVALLCFRPGHALAAVVIPIPILIIVWGTGLWELAAMGIFLAVAALLLSWQLWFKSR